MRYLATMHQRAWTAVYIALILLQLATAAKLMAKQMH